MRWPFYCVGHWFGCKKPKSIIPVVSVLIIYKDKILIGKRAEEPAKGKWAFVGGHLEKGETLRQAAIRETREETGLKIKIKKKLKTRKVLHGEDEYRVHFFVAETKNPHLRLNAETIEAKWLEPEQILSLEFTFTSRQALEEFIKEKNRRLSLRFPRRCASKQICKERR